MPTPNRSGARCPRCNSRQTIETTDGETNEPTRDGFAHCMNCDHRFLVNAWNDANAKHVDDQHATQLRTIARRVADVFLANLETIPADALRIVKELHAVADRLHDPTRHR